MPLDPIQARGLQGGPQGPGTDKLHDTPATKRVRGQSASAPAPPGPLRDRVDVSPVARGLHEILGADGPPSAQMPIEHLRQVLDRIVQGHYDRPEVVEQTVSRLAGDLTDEI